MEDQQLLEQMLNSALREFTTENADKIPSQSGVVVFGNITIHGGLHLGCQSDKSKAQ